jgi:hypothetical protein
MERFETSGFGSTDANVICGIEDEPPCAPTDNIRRHGPTYLGFIDDPCDKLVFEFGCWESPVYLTYIQLSQSYSLAGDSGSPIVGYLPGSNQARLVALHQGRSEGDQQYDDPYMIRVRLANADIQNFLAANIANVATDLDNDGIPDAADNCAPQLRCPNNPANCSNPDQGDLDNDGVGDVCDNCDPRNPKLCPTPTSCTNPQQNNNDGDQYGDICDPFPGCATNDLLTCAGCSASEEKAFCNFATGGAGSCNNLTRYTPSCFPGTCPSTGPGQACLMDGANGRCRLPADADQDGLTDACDLCPNFKNFNPEQPNDNFHAEIAEASMAPPGEVFSLPNVCDPVPIAILDSNVAQATQKINSSGSGLPVSPSDDVLEQKRRSWQFSTRTSLGKLSDTDPNRTFPGTQKFRGCQCDEFNLEQCVSIQGTCTTFDPSASLNWRDITVRNDLGVNIGPSSTAPASFSNQPNPNSFSFWYWDWWQDRQNNVFTLPLLTASEGPDQKFPYMHGAILAETDANNVSDRLTGRSREDNYNLRRTYIELDVGRVVEEHWNTLPPSVISLQVWPQLRHLVQLAQGDLLQSLDLA